MSMSRKHYVAVADLLSRSAAKGTDRATVEYLAVGLADIFAADNSRFDRERFLAAVALGGSDP
jgi:hypothetical protein